MQISRSGQAVLDLLEKEIRAKAALQTFDNPTSEAVIERTILIAGAEALAKAGLIPFSVVNEVMILCFSR